MGPEAEKIAPQRTECNLSSDSSRVTVAVCVAKTVAWRSTRESRGAGEAEGGTREIALAAVVLMVTGSCWQAAGGARVTVGPDGAVGTCRDWGTVEFEGTSKV